MLNSHNNNYLLDFKLNIKLFMIFIICFSYWWLILFSIYLTNKKRGKTYVYIICVNRKFNF